MRMISGYTQAQSNSCQSPAFKETVLSSLLLDRIQLCSAGANDTFSYSRSRHQPQVGRVNERLSPGRKTEQVLNSGLVSRDGIQEGKTPAFHVALKGIC